MSDELGYRIVDFTNLVWHDAGVRRPMATRSAASDEIVGCYIHQSSDLEYNE
jgi:hypothetical protein